MSNYAKTTDENQPKKNECLPTLLNWLGWSPLLHFSSFGTRKPFYAGLSCLFVKCVV